MLEALALLLAVYLPVDYTNDYHKCKEENFKSKLCESHKSVYEYEKNFRDLEK